MPTLSTIGAACARAWGFTSGLVKDQYFNLVSLLLPGNGTNGAQNNTFLDSGTANSGSGFTITRNGNTTQGTFSPFSQTGWGGSFSGSNQLTLPSALALAPEAGQFCIEFWIYPTASWGSVDRPIFVTAGSGGLWVGWQSTAFVLRAYGVTNHLTYATAPTLNTWTHVAICRNSGNTTSMYFNGSRVATGTVTQNFAQAISYIGSDTAYGGGGAALLMASNLSNLRLVKGSSVYDPTQTSITVPTSPLTAVTNTTLLICQSNRFVDNSTANSGSGWAVTSNGNVTITPFSPFAPTQSYSAAAVGGSGYFDGTGDYLSTTGATALSIGTNAFTLEGWCYFNNVNTSGAGFGTCASGLDATSDRGVSLFLTGSGAWRFRIGRSTTGQFEDFLGTTTLTTGQWYHFKIVRTSTSSNDTRIYLNGAQEAIGTSTISLNMQKFAIGTYTPSDATVALLNGYVAGVRFTNTAESSNVPTSPVTAVSGTLYLANFTNAGVVDATAKNVLETVGNAQISTTQSKWGGGSISFDGTGDYLLINNNYLPVLSASGDMTIEMWLYPTSTSSLQMLVAMAGGGSTSDFYFYISTGGLIGVETGSGYRDSATSIITANTWQHVALTKSGSTYKIYVGGTERTITGAGTMLTTLTNSALYIGAGNTGANLLTGYIDDLRVSNMLRYNGNFTPPSAPFPVQ